MKCLCIGGPKDGEEVEAGVPPHRAYAVELPVKDGRHELHHYLLECYHGIDVYISADHKESVFAHLVANYRPKVAEWSSVSVWQAVITWCRANNLGPAHATDLLKRIDSAHKPV
jgi:hypothetical protein